MAATAPEKGPRDTRTLPADAALLPLASGRLLVSPGHAVFCPVPTVEVEAVRQVLEGGGELFALPSPLLEELERHGLFGPPRPAEDDPPSVQIQLTNACNLACTYCCTNSGAPRQGELDFEQAAAMVQGIPAALGPGARVAILGGEPLLVPWALDLASLALDLGLDLTLFTNGTPLADEDLARRLAALVQRGAIVRISLAGATAGACDAESGAPRFQAVLDGLHHLWRHGGRASVDLMLTPGQVGRR